MGNQECGSCYNAGKHRYDLVSPVAMRQLAAVYPKGTHPGPGA